MSNEQNQSDAKAHPVDTLVILACPFCGDTPELPSGDGTLYAIGCDCDMASSRVQICDTMTIEERESAAFVNYRYPEKYIERARDHCIKKWNTRAI